MQFRRAANIYFLIISILTNLSFSPKNPISMMGTFAFIIICTMLKELFEDIRRYKSDQEINSKKAFILNQSDKKFEEKNWEDINVGDITKIFQNEDVSSDVLLIRSSFDTGLCFVDTMNLDGETNLKEKLCPGETRKLKEESVFNMKGEISCEKPNENLEKIDLSLTFSNLEINKSILCGTKQLLLKGSKLKNTEHIYGIVVYTGHETKIMKNAKNPPMKQSSIMVMMNKLLYSVLVFQILLCTVFSVCYLIWQNQIGYKMDYLKKYDENFVKSSKSADFSAFLLEILTFLVAYSHLIPISLYVALEFVKIAQSLLIYFDANMEDPLTNIPALARTSDLIEELGQVEFVFSDKTGTLTRNEMEFRKCSVNFKIYGDKSNDTDSKKQFTLNGDASPYNFLISNDYNSHLDKQALYNFFSLCALCHSAYIDNSKGTINYQVLLILKKSQSPDEIALIEGAAQVGFVFKTKTSETIEIMNVWNEEEVWKLLLELPFDSTRKRMSVIVQRENSEDKNIYLMTKGADSSMLDRMKFNDEDLNHVKGHLEKFAVEGLRTLVFSKKVLIEKYALEFIERFKVLSLSDDRAKEMKIELLFDEIERDLIYIGSSAIEDKLQLGVPEAIESIMNANIRVWVLTGDKKETALEIGKSCKLVLPEDIMDSIDLASPSNKDDTLEVFSKRLDAAFSKHCSEEKISMISKINNETKKLYLIIDGKNLSYVINDEELSKKFFNIGILANSVICCRVSPKQKSQVVGIAKKNSKWITLSIGDGANDVPMIMEAHIGIGISGKEGTQAVRSADYAISQFRFLKRLLFIHGRVGYRRISYFICYYFYKNIILVFTEFYFAIYNGFSGQIFFADFYSLLYNAVYTSWPCILCYSFERDVGEEIALNFPILYRAGQIEYYFNLKRFWSWIILAFLHGLINFFTSQYGLAYFLSDDGITKDHWFKSSVSFISIIHIVTYKPFVDMMHWNWIIIIISCISVLFFYIVTIILCIPKISYIFQNEINHKIFDIFIYLKTWLFILFLPVISLYVDVIIRHIQYNFFPSPADILFKNKDYYTYFIQDKGKTGPKCESIKKKFGEDSYSPLKGIDNSKIINDDKIKFNPLSDKTNARTVHQIQFDSPDHFSVKRKKTELSDLYNDKSTKK